MGYPLDGLSEPSITNRKSIAVAGISVTSKHIPLMSMKNPSTGAAQLKNISR